MPEKTPVSSLRLWRRRSDEVPGTTVSPFAQPNTPVLSPCAQHGRILSRARDSQFRHHPHPLLAGGAETLCLSLQGWLLRREAEENIKQSVRVQGTLEPLALYALCSALLCSALLAGQSVQRRIAQRQMTKNGVRKAQQFLADGFMTHPSFCSCAVVGLENYMKSKRGVLCGKACRSIGLPPSWIPWLISRRVMGCRTTVWWTWYTQLPRAIQR